MERAGTLGGGLSSDGLYATKLVPSDFYNQYSRGGFYIRNTMVKCINPFSKKYALQRKIDDIEIPQ